MLCSICSEICNKNNILNHLQHDHLDQISVQCPDCSEIIVGGVKEVLFHRSVIHQKWILNMNEFICFKVQSKEFIKKYEYLNQLEGELVKKGYTATCPFCKLEIQFESKFAFFQHLDSLHTKDICDFFAENTSILKIFKLADEQNHDKSDISVENKFVACFPAADNSCKTVHISLEEKDLPPTQISEPESFPAVVVYPEGDNLPLEIRFPVETQFISNNEAPEVSKLSFDDKINCDICDETLHSAILSHHYWAAHRDMANCLGHPDPFKINKNKTTCPICEEIVLLRLFRTHLKDLHNIKVPRKCQITYKEKKSANKRRKTTILQQYYPHLRKKDETEVTCPECKMALPARNLNEHYRNIHVKNIECSTCNLVFPTSYIRHKHMIEVHNYTKPTKKHCCHICKQLFLKPSHLDLHFKTIHEKRRDYICHVCGKAFKNNTVLTKHKRNVHLGLKQFKCKVCSKRFKSSDTCKKHIKNTHHVDVQGRLNNPFTGPNMLVEKIE